MYNHILWSFNQPLAVLPEYRNSAALNAYVAVIMYAYGRIQMLDNCAGRAGDFVNHLNT